MLLGDVVDEFGDENRLAHAGAAEQADFAAARIGLEQVDDLDAGLKRFDSRRQILETWSGAVNRKCCSASTGPRPSRSLPSTSNKRPRVASPTGTVIGAPVSTASMPRTRPSVDSIAMQRTTLSPRVLRDFGDQIGLRFATGSGSAACHADHSADGYPRRAESRPRYKCRAVARRQLDVNDRPDDLHDFSCCHITPVMSDE